MMRYRRKTESSTFMLLVEQVNKLFDLAMKAVGVYELIKHLF